MKHLIMFAALALSACETTRGIETTKIVEKVVPVAVQPIRPDQIPALPPPLGARPPSAPQAADAAFAAHCRDVAFIIKAMPLLLVSAGLAPAQAPSFPECERR
jgi:hypothetical protein